MINPNKKEKQQKPKIEISRRETGGKKKPDLFSKFRNNEHPLDSIIPNETAELENPVSPYPSIVNPGIDNPILPQTELPINSSDSLEEKKVLASVSPTNNYTKLSNSLIKQAIPEGFFRGQSKHTYDVLYQHTRGAINPIREIQLTKVEIVRLTGLEIKTIQRHLSFLRSIGLLVVNPKIGDHKGAIYEVKIPEEITLPYPTLPQNSIVQPTLDKATVNSTPHPSINSTTLGYGKPIENKGSYEIPKTSLKTNTKNDDEPAALAPIIEVLETTLKKLTGKGSRIRETENWRQLGELLAMELEIAAARTESISNIPAFLTEHLRRRLMRSPEREIKVKNSSNKNFSKREISQIDQLPEEKETTNNLFEVEALSEQGRETVVKAMKDYLEKGQREFVISLEDSYTKEDWQWLMINLNE